MSELKTYTFWQLANEYSVEIPIVQRDYAQGRDEAKVNEVRNKFLDDLFAALINEKSIELDFVYGKVKDNVFIPIDGQQRLTTLFLLHWYIAVKVEKPFDKIDFSYKTRISAREFCKELIKNVNVFLIKDTLVISDEIKNASWFFISWKRDPSVKAILTMLDAIHDKFKEADCEAIWQKLITPNYLLPNDNPKLDALIQVIDKSDYSELKEKLAIVRQKPSISFKFLNLEAFQLTDELYLKMNARGKHLSDFENFKAWLIGYVEDLIKENNVDVNDFKEKWCSQGLDNWQNKIDGIWTDLFWGFKDGENKIDYVRINFFRAMALNNYAITFEVSKDETDDNKQKKEKRYEEIIKLFRDKQSTIYTSIYEEMKCFDSKSLSLLFDVLENLKFDAVANHDVLDEKGLFKNVIDNSLTFTERVQFYAYSLFISNNVKNKNSNEWFRLVRNLTENTDIDASNLSSALKSILHLSKIDNLYLFLEDKGGVSFFNKEQVVEERAKACLINKDENWEKELLKAENHPLFKGNIGFLLPDGENSDVDFFINRKDIALHLFDAKGVTIGKNNNLLGRVLLAMGLDFKLINEWNLRELWLGGKSNQYWKEHLKDAYYNSFILKAIDLLMNVNVEKYVETFESILDKKEEINKLPFWVQTLIKHPILFEYYSCHGGVKMYGSGIFIFERENFSEKTNAILIKNNRNEIITRFCDSGFKLINPSCKKHDYFYSGYKIVLQKDDLELIFDVDTIKINGEASQIELLKTDFQTYFAHSVENSLNEFLIDTPSV